MDYLRTTSFTASFTASFNSKRFDQIMAHINSVQAEGVERSKIDKANNEAAITKLEDSIASIGDSIWGYGQYAWYYRRF